MVQVGKLLFPQAPRPVNGRIVIPDRPGLGLVVDRDALRETRVAGK
jgi:L-alanine-DL-glutamate epimerase-like enolase superfamily enzyme